MQSPEAIRARIHTLNAEIRDLERRYTETPDALALQMAILTCEQEIIGLEWVLGETIPTTHTATPVEHQLDRAKRIIRDSIEIVETSRIGDKTKQKLLDTLFSVLDV